METEFIEMRRCLLDPIPEIFEAAKLLDQAVDAHLSGDRTTASKLIASTNQDIIREWTEAMWGGFNPDIHHIRNIPNSPPILAKADRVPARMPSKTEKQAMVDRDGSYCRFCGIPVIDPSLRNAIKDEYPEALRWGHKNTEQHAAFQCMWLQFDHVLPHSRGGDNSLSNVVITCAPCNFSRMHYTIEELGLLDPRAFPPIVGDWDGLNRFVSGRHH